MSETPTPIDENPGADPSRDLELERALEAAESARRELEAFTYAVTHDLRTPLRSIDGFSQALLEDFGPALEERGRLYLHHVREASQNISTLLDGLHRLTRISSAELRLETVDLAAFFRLAFEDLRRAGPDRRVEVVVADLPPVHGDPTLLAIAASSLADNAWKFTRNREGARIEVGFRRAGGRTVFFVEDDGVGFDMRFAHRLFGVFQRLHSAREFEGSGVGLATVERVVRRHGGKVWAEGAPGEGATFSFTLEGEESTR